MTPATFADALVVLHLAFIVFVVAGGLLVLWRRAFAFAHLPALAWGAYTEFTGTICPLTPWEQALRARAGATYSGGFVDHYVVPLIYPPGLTPAMQVAIGVALVALNAVVYAIVWRRAVTPSPRAAGRGSVRQASVQQ
jgi:hypothetical protein